MPGRLRVATNYSRGRAFEYRTRNKLLDAGAAYVMRAAQSKGAADLAAFWPTEEDWASVWLVQCKTGSARMSREAKREFVDLAWKTGARPVLAQPGKNGRGIQFIDLQAEEEIQL